MKTSSLLSIILAFLMVSYAFGQKTELKPYGIKSGVIDYKFSGTQEGVGILYFDDYGLRSNMFLDAMEGGRHQKGYTLTLGDDQYIYDLEKSGEGVKMKNPMFRDLKEGDVTETLLRKVYGKMGLNRAGSTSFLDRECDLWTGEQGEALVWNGILLKLDLEMYGNTIHQEATSMKINIPIDPSIFKIPEGVEFTEMPGFNF
jgi:hypothetical protein